MKTLEERFFNKVNKTHSCWEWTAGKDRYGYGSIRINNKVLRTHRVSYQLHYGDFDIALFVCHKCDNKKCVNPEHLFLGTHQDNMTDKVNKGKQPNLIGKNNPNTKLTEDNVIQIKKLLFVGMKQREIAQKYNVSQNQISQIKNNKAWKHI
jgi:predicted XRE-type DNA-binding protein